MKTEEMFSFSTKTKQIAFSLGLAGTKQRKTNGILPFTHTQTHTQIHTLTHTHLMSNKNIRYSFVFICCSAWPRLG